MTPRIRRITLTAVRVPIPVERVNCPDFHETLNRGPDGNWGGPFFADVPFYVVKVEGDGAPIGWADSSRAVDPDLLLADARAFIGYELPRIDEALTSVERRFMAAHAAASQQITDREPSPPVYHKCIETAVLDWVARHHGVPLHALFGTKVRDGVRIEMWSAFRTPAAAARIARDAKDRGFLGLKLKANLKIDAVGIAREVAAACGTQFSLNIDPNGRWETYENVLERARGIVGVNPNVLLEDPLYGHVTELARVRRETNVRMAITVTELSELSNVLSADAADAVNVIGTWGQIRAAAHAAHVAHIPCWLGSGCECGLSDLSAIHMAATLPNCTLGSDLVAHIVRDDDLLLEPIVIERGLARVPDIPGIGTDADEQAVERYRIGDPAVIET